ncbi:TIGR00374 family protein [Methylobacterium currus]|uniref:TIGR00374 family protein n=1 Tax=Methylobacterium currus TaxID=2051553 RepID=A0A2R4WV53_9HYPH|nr:lysylphosphatidylglycerol synthase domain-containing protein [Methylobacterium currus]AWB25427.1 TIGR00374 family protein [Methylobacterium currus]UHC19781.1 lysylphosphatidylglycerol synthase domain-containing protein [Methylobacterium currus]
MKRLTTLGLIAGLCTVIGLFVSSGPEAVAEALWASGWGALLVVAARFVAVAWAGLGWWVVFPRGERPLLRACVSVRFVREGINTLLPVAQVGGDLIGARLLTRQGVTGALSGASTLVDLMVQALTQFLFTLAGLGILVALGGDGPIVHYVGLGLVVAAPALLAFYLVQRRFGQSLLQAAINRFAGGREWRIFGAVDVLFERLRGLYAARGRIVTAIGTHLFGWIIGTLEVWIALRFMGYEVGFLEAIVIESLAQAVRGAAFAVPGALGAQEGGLIALCAVFGIPAEAALALSLIKRLADLAVGLPSLMLWHAMENDVAQGRSAAAGIGAALRARFRPRPAPLRQAPMPAYGYAAAPADGKGE